MTGAPTSSISAWLQFHKFIASAPSGKNRFAMNNLLAELKELTQSRYDIMTSEDVNTHEVFAIGILLPTPIYKIGAKLVQDNFHGFTITSRDTKSIITQTVTNLTSSVEEVLTDDLLLVQLLMTYFGKTL